MTEEEYILVSNLRFLQQAILGIKNVCGSDIVDEKELKEIKKKLFIWVNSHYLKIDV